MKRILPVRKKYIPFNEEKDKNRNMEIISYFILFYFWRKGGE